MISIKPNSRGRVLPPTKTQRTAPTRGQLAVLGAIAKQPVGTRVTSKMIAYDLGINENTAQMRLTRMEKAGLIRRGGWEIASS